MQKVVVVDNVRSVLNVGSLFRTANALGVNKIFLCGITPTPLDKHGNKRSDFAKVALGSEEGILWSYKETAKEVLENLKNEGFYIVALEQSENSVYFREVKGEEKTAIVVGSEVDGISEDVLHMCDTVAEIPMLGLKESLNVTIAFGVLGYSLFEDQDSLRKK